MDYVEFYKNLPELQIPLADLLEDPSQFGELPTGWNVVITDIRNSTGAVDSGDHQIVNLVATGSIIAVINIAHRHDVSMPFFFGGDGATLLIPDNLLEVCLKALNAHKDNVRDNFGLELRVGSVPLHELTDAGFSIRIAKLCLNSHLTIPVVLGMGLYEAERRIKADDLEMVGLKDAKELDLTGMNCRWDKIEPPRDPGEILTLLVESKDGSNQGAALASVIRVIEDIYGPLAQRIPISADKMQLKADAKAIGAETILQFGKLKWPYYVVNRFLTFIGKFFYGKTPSSREYMKSLVLLSDTLSIDGRINTVISGTEEQRKRLLVGLLELEEKGKIVFGAHISAQSIMSCYVRNHEDEHLHFVDGSEGGYTQAAKILKGKLRT